MRILITNDDSVSAEQLLPLIRYFSKLGEVTAVVPKLEQSGKSHGINIHSAFSVQKQMLDKDIFAYVVDSTPADCVRYALIGLGLEFDLVVSGINRGFNMGTDVMYSGTVAAVCEAVLHKIPGIALSTSPEYYDRAISHLDEVFDYISSRKLLDVHNAYNINIPPEPQGINITRQGYSFYSDNFVEVEDEMFKAEGKCIYKSRNDLTLDTDSVMSGYISVMPLTINMTDKEIYSRLNK